MTLIHPKKHLIVKMFSITVVVTLLVSVIPCFSITAKAEEKDDRIIVSMGDSFSSGEGIEDFYDYDKPLENRIQSQDWLSHRSKNAWSGMHTVPTKDGTMTK